MSERSGGKNKGLIAREQARLSKVTADKFNSKLVRFGELIVGSTTTIAASVYSTKYNHGIELLSSYGQDFLGPSAAVLTGQLIANAVKEVGFPIPPRFTHSSRPYLTGALILGYTHEALQYLQQQKTPDYKGYDPVDLGMYAIGAIFAYRLSRAINGSQTPEKPTTKKRRKR